MIMIILIVIGAHMKESGCTTTYGIHLQIMMPVILNPGHMFVPGDKSHPALSAMTYT